MRRESRPRISILLPAWFSSTTALRSSSYNKNTEHRIGNRSILKTPINGDTFLIGQIYCEAFKWFILCAFVAGFDYIRHGTTTVVFTWVCERREWVWDISLLHRWFGNLYKTNTLAYLASLVRCISEFAEEGFAWVNNARRVLLLLSQVAFLKFRRVPWRLEKCSNETLTSGTYMFAAAYMLSYNEKREDAKHSKGLKTAFP